MDGIGSRGRILECESITRDVIGAAIEVHKALGPGLLESAYERCLMHELELRGLGARSQVAVPVVYKGVELDCGYRLDVVVEGRVLLELKSIDQLLPIHEAQLITYLRVADLPVGLLINFNTALLKDGIIRRANTHPAPRPPRLRSANTGDLS